MILNIINNITRDDKLNNKIVHKNSYVFPVLRTYEIDTSNMKTIKTKYQINRAYSFTVVENRGPWDEENTWKFILFDTPIKDYIGFVIHAGYL